MLEKIDDKSILSVNAARSKYPRSKVLFIVTDMSNMSDIKGYVFMVSRGSSTFEDLCDEDDKLQEEGFQTIILGSYENGGAIGVQYELD